MDFLARFPTLFGIIKTLLCFTKQLFYGIEQTPLMCKKKRKSDDEEAVIFKYTALFGTDSDKFTVFSGLGKA
jgi:hypothetical protein